MTSATPALNRPADLVESAAGRFITELQRGFLADRPAAVGALAQLRRGAGKLPEDVPELWGSTGVERLFAEENLFAGETQATRAEAAYFLAVTLYALHQQSQGGPMHKTGVDLGQAVRQLMAKQDRVDETIRRRFVRVGTAATPEILAYRLREVISLLRGKGIPLDYGRLARQLYKAQTPDGLNQIRRDWGRSFHTYKADAGDGAPTDKDTA
ncbi:type I-E CRISPR-associated protein Cse2/CasB [Actinomadura formosensis]|uniref:type I-E CRISPR-associated protein Cse2/CasB n=1 Tax=Actinomadura formosensis TaxID=60706 RepID=UPI0008300AD6|nr:type I-E CRISPR-associated protein Cse2/CasB [Actinomadura formosensis]